MSRIPVLIALGLCLACRSQGSGETVNVMLHSDPAGAEFRTDAGHSGVTPAQITTDPRETLVIVFSHVGYESQRVVLPAVDSGVDVTSEWGSYRVDGPNDDGSGERDLTTVGWQFGVSAPSRGSKARARTVDVRLEPLPDTIIVE